MATINSIRQHLKNAGFNQYKSYWIGRAWVGREFGDYSVKKETETKYTDRFGNPPKKGYKVKQTSTPTGNIQITVKNEDVKKYVIGFMGEPMRVDGESMIYAQ